MAISWGIQPRDWRAAREPASAPKMRMLAGVGKDAAHDAANERAFAGAVGAEQAEALAWVEAQGDTVDGGERAEALDEIRDFNGKRGDGWRACDSSHPDLLGCVNRPILRWNYAWRV